MADVAHIVSACAQRAKKLDRGHDSNVDAHRNRHWKRNQQHALVREQYSRSNQHAVDRSGRSNCGSQRGSDPMRIQDRLHDHIDNARANTTKKIINVKALLAPRPLDAAPKHPQHEHVDQDVPDALMQEKIGERLPDETMNGVSRNQSKPYQPEIPSSGAKKYAG